MFLFKAPLSKFTQDPQRYAQLAAVRSQCGATATASSCRNHNTGRYKATSLSSINANTAQPAECDAEEPDATSTDFEADSPAVERLTDAGNQKDAVFCVNCDHLSSECARLKESVSALSRTNRRLKEQKARDTDLASMTEAKVAFYIAEVPITGIGPLSVHGWAGRYLLTQLPAQSTQQHRFCRPSPLLSGSKIGTAHLEAAARSIMKRHSARSREKISGRPCRIQHATSNVWR
ncbi:hypothetical protein V5799_029724 [Amblyomma americanum]|uniref:Uncharacterized protein n=1 Tax=Amblyomma americanum TaxID=6943 RepID=A0AAQ4EQA4_AMBAM